MNNSTKELLYVAKLLKDRYFYSEALEIINSIKNPDKNALYIKAQCIYQNHKIPLNKRFKQSINILDKLDDKDDETKRLKGAVYKRKYQHSKDIKDLYQSIDYYEKSAKDKETDRGYGALNAIYLYFELINYVGDVLPKEIKEDYLTRVKTLATEVLDVLENISDDEKTSWDLASMSSLYLSLYDFDKCKIYLDKYKIKLDDKEIKTAIEIDDVVERFPSIKDSLKTAINMDKTINRELFVTLEQTIKMFDLLPDVEKKDEKIYEILETFENHKGMVDSVRIGKIGLALSGGGFRASLFHIGVLMRLAELDMLRYVQVISSVSGGSIIAMHYYLKLKVLLENKENNLINKSDYITLVKDLKTEFMQGVQSNIRMKALAQGGNKDLTKKIGELYQKEFYDKIEGSSPTLMKDLSILPKSLKTFDPHFNNFELQNKVPALIINATVLNNGHNWQFTAEGMGENLYMYDITIDKNPSYDFKKYKDINRPITIADAVASSSAVPVLFDPIEYKELYKKGETIKLSDGGLYDNLGLASLVNEECSHIIVSDGSKQLEYEEKPSSFRFDMLGQIQDILMNKTRESEYEIAKNLKSSGVIDALAIIHLKDEDKNGNSIIDSKLQNALASVRTDLDAFHEIESEALIYGGYHITFHWFEKNGKENGWNGFSLDVEKESDFSKFEQRYLYSQDEVLLLLKKSSKRFFRDIGLHDGRILTQIKKGVKIVTNKTIAWVMIPFSRGYVKYRNKYYLNEGKL